MFSGNTFKLIFGFFSLVLAGSAIAQDDIDQCTYSTKLYTDARKLVTLEKSNLNKAISLQRSVNRKLNISYPRELSSIENELLRNDERNRACFVSQARAQARFNAQNGKEQKLCHGVIGTIFGEILNKKKCDAIEIVSRRREAELKAQKEICINLVSYVDQRAAVLENRRQFIQQLSDLKQSNVVGAYEQSVAIVQDQVTDARAAYDQTVAHANAVRANAIAACTR